MTILIALFGGIALLLYGIRLSGEALQRVLGVRLKSLLTGLSRYRLLAVASGTSLTQTAIFNARPPPGSATRMQTPGFAEFSRRRRAARGRG